MGLDVLFRKGKYVLNIKGILGGFVIGLLFIMSYGCSDSGVTPTSPKSAPAFDTVSFATEIRDTIVARCGLINCHGGGVIRGGLNMGTVSWSEIRNASGLHGPIINPGSASTSNLYLKTTDSPPFLVRMPNGGPFLSDETQSKIRDWINQGALDN